MASTKKISHPRCSCLPPPLLDNSCQAKATLHYYCSKFQNNYLFSCSGPANERTMLRYPTPPNHCETPMRGRKPSGRISEKVTFQHHTLEHTEEMPREYKWYFLLGIRGKKTPLYNIRHSDQPKQHSMHSKTPQEKKMQMIVTSPKRNNKRWGRRR